MNKLFIISLLFFSCNKIDNILSVTAMDNFKAPSANRTNIVLIVVDDLGYEILSSYGGQSYSTPNIDSFASHGVRFTNCYGTSLCSPSRFEIMTGNYNFRNYKQWGNMDTTILSLADRFRNYNYQTCVVGKWQFGGGDASIKALGFNSYCVNEAFAADGESSDKYRSPSIYQNGGYLPDSAINGKYSEDIFYDYAANFIDTVGKKPFFLYYSFNLVHFPFQPTPKDSNYATWGTTSDTQYFKSMVKYADSLIGKIVAKVPGNTIVLITGDNGTAQSIYSSFNDTRIKGGKNTTTTYGTHLPLIAYVKANPVAIIDSSLIDFTDFYPTLVTLAGMPVHVTVDGVSFADQVKGITPTTQRTWSFTHFQPYPTNKFKELTRWVQDKNYKLYDTQVLKTSPANVRYGKLYDIANDPYELNPITNETIDSTFKIILSSMHK